jgi:acetate kinase
MLAKGLLERIGLNDSILTHRPTGKDPYRVISDIPDHTTGINQVMSVLTDIRHGVITDVRK